MIPDETVTPEPTNWRYDLLSFLPLVLNVVLLEAIFFRFSGAVLPWTQGLVWPSISVLSAAQGEAVAGQMKAAVLVGSAAGILGAVYLLLFCLATNRGQRFRRGGLKAVLFWPILAVLLFGGVYVFDDSFLISSPSRLHQVSPGWTGMILFAFRLYYFSWSATAAVLAVLGMVQGSEEKKAAGRQGGAP